MSCFLAIFTGTYFFRWISDAYIVPNMIDNSYEKCTLGEIETVCVTANFIQYYTWTSLIFDWLPLFVIIYFHHSAFRLQGKMDLYS